MMTESLKSRLVDRSNSKLLSTALYLKYGKWFTAKINSSGIKLISKQQAANSAKALFERLHDVEEESYDLILNVPVKNQQADDASAVTLSDRLNKMIEEAQGENDASRDKNKKRFN